ncbi:PREDICTED: Bardet-Biedl syndrome 12 protein-like isoform X1 [Branchiostoma belcheri]|uniref:Bardet-Biedl syndrome 12 protein-like isoform X1 n=1 Tax=Branchiostoma belcheri TaxID=7741 RepID=A0A6P4XY88_BRABE|nr:PREDICTED: Bardet-Biedl syndrome 12 protein-like isoform X1 [Branchiostoma belcheri]
MMATISEISNGLDVLMSVASCAQSLLGPQRTLKCIVDDSGPEGSVLVSTAPDLLSNLNIDHPVGQLLNSACQSHHRTYGTGSKTLVCMAGFLARAARHCIHLGIPFSAVCHCLEEGVRMCCEEVEKTAIIVDKVLCEKSTEIVRTDYHTKTIPFASVQQTDSTGTLTTVSRQCENESDDVDDISWYFEPQTIAPFSSARNPTLHVQAINVDASRTEDTDSIQKSFQQKFQESDVLPTDDDEEEDEFSACFEETFPSKSSSNACHHGETLQNKSVVTQPSKKPDMTREGFEQLLKSKLKENDKNRKLQIRSRHLGLVDFLPSEPNPPLQLQDLDSHNASEKTEDYPKQSNLLQANETSLTLSRLSQGLSHGNCVEMQLACKVFQQILHERQGASPGDFDITNTCLVSGVDHKQSYVTDGIVVKVGSGQLASILQGKNKPRKVLIINGDITENFHHTGYKKALEVSSIQYGARSYKAPKSWLERVQKVILDCDVELLLAKGIVDQDVMEVCLSMNCVVVQQVKYSTLQTLADATGAFIITYIHNSTSLDVGAVTSLELLEDHTLQSYKGASMLMKIGTPGQTWSAVLCCLTKAELHHVEQQFWICLHRLKNALAEGKVLPGGGSPELTCIRCLRDTSGAHHSLSGIHPGSWLSLSIKEFRPVVFSSLAESFEQYLLSVMVNSGRFSSPHHARAEMESLLKGQEGSKASLERVACHKQTLTTAANADKVSAYWTDQPTTHTTPVKQDDKLCLESKVSTQFLPVEYSQQNADRQEKSISEMQKSSDCEVLDCMCKLEAWKSAASLVQLVLRTDTEIINGPKEDFHKVL